MFFPLVYTYRRKIGGVTMVKRLNLKVLRVLKGLTLKQAAEKLDVSSATLSNWERGITYPDVKYIKQIEKLYDIEFKDIVF